MTTVYVQQNLRGEWINECCFISARGFNQRGYEVIPFTSNQLDDGNLPLTQETIVHGGASQVHKALRQIGVRPPDLMDYPHCLRRGFLDIEPRERKLGDVLEMFHKPDFQPVFIKPSRTQKLFTGFVVEEFKDLLKVRHVENSEYVWVQRPIEFLSEYRIFIHKNEMVGMKHYAGDPLVLPDVDTVRKLLKRAKAMVQVAYSLDIGIANFPKRPPKIQTPTLLVEANDAYALGSYGLPGWIYVQMIEDRWNQMMKISR